MIDIMGKANDLREALVDGFRVSLDTPEDYEVSICQVKDGYNIVTNLKTNMCRTIPMALYFTLSLAHPQVRLTPGLKITTGTIM